MTSRRVSRPAVAEWRSRSISSLIDESFSMYVSLDGDVRLGLVVVVVADEVLDPVVGEELADLLGQLGGEALVRGQDQRRLLGLLDRPGDRRRLARPGDAEQRLEAVATSMPSREPGDGLRLVARGAKSDTTRNGCSCTRPSLPPEHPFCRVGSPTVTAPAVSPAAAVHRVRCSRSIHGRRPRCARSATDPMTRVDEPVIWRLGQDEVAAAPDAIVDARTGGSSIAGLTSTASGTFARYR